MHEDSMKPHVLSLDQVRCLGSAVRNEIYQRFRALQPASVADVAESLGKSVELVHYHARELLKNELIAEVEKRPSGRRPESVYRATHRVVELPKSGEGAGAAVRDMVVGSLKLTARQYEKASIAAEEDPEVARSMHVIRAIVRLSDADMSKFLGMIEEVATFLKENQSPEGKSVTWSSAVYPNLSSKRGSEATSE